MATFGGNFDFVHLLVPGVQVKLCKNCCQRVALVPSSQSFDAALGQQPTKVGMAEVGVGEQILHLIVGNKVSDRVYIWVAPVAFMRHGLITLAAKLFPDFFGRITGSALVVFVVIPNDRCRFPAERQVFRLPPAEYPPHVHCRSHNPDVFVHTLSRARRSAASARRNLLHLVWLQWARDSLHWSRIAFKSSGRMGIPRI